MFNRRIYDANAKWRNEPASEAQKRYILQCGGSVPADLTKGEASDRIASTNEPNDDEIEFLRFFGIKLDKDATQFDAVKHIYEIIADPANKLKWEARPATAEQREIIREVLGKVPAKLTAPEAEKLIWSFDDDEDLSAKLEAAEDARNAREDRIAFIRDHADTLSSGGDVFGVKRVGFKLVKQVIEDWEHETGTTLEQLEEHPSFLDELAARVRDEDPSKASKDYLRDPSFYDGFERVTVPVKPSPSSRSGWQPHPGAFPAGTLDKWPKPPVPPAALPPSGNWKPDPGAFPSRTADPPNPPERQHALSWPVKLGLASILLWLVAHFAA